MLNKSHHNQYWKYPHEELYRNTGDFVGKARLRWVNQRRKQNDP
jgi:hypothetical protein